MVTGKRIARVRTVFCSVAALTPSTDVCGFERTFSETLQSSSNLTATLPQLGPLQRLNRHFVTRTFDARSPSFHEEQLRRFYQVVLLCARHVPCVTQIHDCGCYVRMLRTCVTNTCYVHICYATSMIHLQSHYIAHYDVTFIVRPV